ncbi:MAG: GNAT family N-acetyltransferase, partial [Deltaproteobacteria bacterium]|nr:GNAT family N-acetyltransferase [Deltaproteobacteria bacterium]
MHDRQRTESKAARPAAELEATMGGSDLGWIHDAAKWFCLEPMRPSDLPEVLAIEQACFKSPWSQASFEAEMQKSYADLKVARLSTKDGIGPVVGYGCCWLVADEIQITNLAVHNDYRRRGVGRRLMMHILQQGY